MFGLKRLRRDHRLAEMNALAVVRAMSKSQATIEFTLDGIILDANDNFLKLLGYDLQDVVGQHHRMFVDPTYANSTDYNEFWVALKRGEYRTSLYKRYGKGGREVWIQASYNPLLDAQGRPHRILKLASDVTALQMSSANWAGNRSNR